MYVHVQKLDRAHAEARYNEYVRTRVLGSGGMGQVHEACRVDECDACRTSGERCRYAIKVADLTEDDATGGAIEAAAYRDVFFLNYLANKRVDGERIVPVLYDAWIQKRTVGSGFSSLSSLRHKRYFYIVMERFDGDMAHLAHARALARERDPQMHSPRSPLGRGERKTRALRAHDVKEVRERAGREMTTIYTEGELRRMFRIAAQMGVLNGDIKPDQYLYRVKETDGKATDGGNATAAETHTIVITDFGFAGLGGNPKREASWGWPGGKPAARLGCPTAYEILKGDAAYMNVLILEQSLLVAHPVGVRVSVPPRTRSRHTETRDYIFAGIRDLDRSSSQNVCTGYTNETVRDLTRTEPSTNIFTLTLDDLLR